MAVARGGRLCGTAARRLIVGDAQLDRFRLDVDGDVALFDKRDGAARRAGARGMPARRLRMGRSHTPAAAAHGAFVPSDASCAPRRRGNVSFWQPSSVKIA